MSGSQETIPIIHMAPVGIKRVKDDRQKFLQQVSKKQFRTLYHNTNRCG